MKHYHVAAFTLQGAADVYPTLGVCAELINRRYSVSYATTERFSQRIREVGAKPVIFEAHRFGHAEPLLKLPRAADPNFWQVFASVLCPMWFIQTMTQLAQLESYYRKNPPDLIIYSRMCFSGKILATRLGVPAIQLAPHFAAYKNLLVRVEGSYTNPEPMLAFARLLDIFMSTQGVATEGNLWLAEEMNICFVPKEFQMHGETFDDSFCFVGPCLIRPRRGIWVNKASGKPTVLVSGSQADSDANYFKVVIEALSGSKFHVVLSLGGNLSEESLGAIPDNFEINREAYNIEVMPHAVLTICQAGMGTVMESLYYGVPVLAIPRTPVHAEVGYRVAELGVGACISEGELTSEGVSKCVNEVLNDPSLQNRMKSMQSVFNECGGAVLAADFIERGLGIRHSSSVSASGQL